MPKFRWTPKQLEALTLSGSQARHQMLFGGSRSGKTFVHVRNILWRAIRAPESRHAILRFRFNRVKQYVCLDTYPKVISLCFPGLEAPINKSDWYSTLPNGSEIWFGGLDEKERVDKILGGEYSTVFLNECSEISWDAVAKVRTRLAQNATIDGTERRLPLRMYYDCNPPSKAHWTYMQFIRKVDPETREQLANPDQYVSLQMNPGDNIQNLGEGYLDELRSLSGRHQRRFLQGEFADATPNQLFSEEDIDRWRVLQADRLPEFIRVVVGVDPSGSGDTDNADNDEIGIAVGALGTDGNAYLLEDCSVKAGPATWGRIAASAWERHRADCVVAEVNYGGAMVAQTIKVANPRIPYRKVTASRGKMQRAEPFSALYEQGKVRHVGMYSQLETELCAFSTIGYLGGGSPNRADAWIWVLAELFPGLTKAKSTPTVAREERYLDDVSAGTGWMMG